MRGTRLNLSFARSFAANGHLGLSDVRSACHRLLSGFGFVNDAPSLAPDGRPKRWVVVPPPGASSALRP